ncbi:DUF676-domain-containing protein [Fomitiporia mediterranea MF3/22]|uniref:DUF676-domain-containing protein n=1 Tax=Fomitiporia mediterranea (strain MF3/22) TaxID=694068 RepID=UPI00044089FB|nr:DUF676-domain-containing protein [Fomitiporia mediterranea MF3/22]EJD07230.1 DUF676-domain-containing protein [Fomitiporia mediterranea MF3/22]
MSVRNVHLLILVHGMWGNPAHLAEMCRIIKESKGPDSLHHSKNSTSKESANDGDDVELDVLVAKTNRDESTYDGIDWGGERVADEVLKRVDEIEKGGGKVVKFSIAGYSLGGLLSRYVVGILYQRNFFTHIKPVNFATFATPHIGLVRAASLWSTITWFLGPRMLSRTGEQFYAVDKWGVSGRALLEVMADPKEIFYQALCLFEHIRIYGNAVNDLTVPYSTALIEPIDPFVDRSKTGINVEFDPKYEPIMLSYSTPDTPPVKVVPKPLSPAWFKSFNPSRFLPPPLQSLKFPLNVLALVLLPVLIPAFLSMILVRLSLHTRSSRARIRLLEGNENALVHAVSRFERGIEEAVVDAIEDDQGSTLTPPRREKSFTDVNGEALDASSSWFTPPPAKTQKTADHTRTPSKPKAKFELSLSSASTSRPDSPLSSPTSASAPHSELHSELHSEAASESEEDNDDTDSLDTLSTPDAQPVLTPQQLQMIRKLNALPRMTKHRAYIDPLRNSHATIVARDVVGYAFHKRGWGVLRHWADAFEV